jgi:tetratricopeptide (TPR) repeat protein
MLGRIYLREGKRDRAIRYLQQAIDVNPSQVDAARLLKQLNSEN